METIGTILPNGEVEKAYYGQGFIYKNFNAFKNKTDEVCYVPELTDTDNVSEGYKYKDFVAICEGFIERNEDVKTYCKSNNTTAEDIANNLFGMVDWQHPETLVDEWEIHGSYTE